LCLVAAIETYIPICDLIGALVRQGFLFRPVNPSGEILPTSFDSSAAQARLKSYTQQLSHIFKNRWITLHGLRSGCAISSALAETDHGSYRLEDYLFSSPLYKGNLGSSARRCKRHSSWTFIGLNEIF